MITIIGAGIGGLTAGIALVKQGFHVEIFESAQAFKRIGAGIILGNNAMQVYRRLGFQEKLEAAGNRVSTFKVVDPQLNTLSQLILHPFEEKYGLGSVAIHRGELQRILSEQFTGKIHFNKKLSSISTQKDKVQLEFMDGTKKEATTVIGADGIHSKVREALGQEIKIRNAHQACWRGVTKFTLPTELLTQVNEMWAKGKRFGIVPLKDGEVYWFGLTNYKNGFQATAENTNLAEVFSDCHPLISQIINATRDDEMIVNEITDLKPIQQWYNGSVCTIGDAAHATTPNMGQGAGQAIEDGLCLSLCMANHPNPNEAFANFQKIREKKVVDIVQQSWRIGGIAQLENSLGIAFRNMLMKLTPDATSARQMDKVFSLNF